MRSLQLTEGKTWSAIVDRDSSQPGVKLVVPGDPERSLLYQAIRGLAPNTRQMPLGGSLTQTEVNELREWIAAGAKDD
jgi:hypothetical protein